MNPSGAPPFPFSLKLNPAEAPSLPGLLPRFQRTGPHFRSMVLAAGWFCTCAQVHAQPPAAVTESNSRPPVSDRPALLLVQGAAGEPEFASRFSSQIKAWQEYAQRSQISCTVIGSPTGNGSAVSSDRASSTSTDSSNSTPPPPDSPDPAPPSAAPGSSPLPDDRTLLQQWLSGQASAACPELWIVLIGHGTWNGKIATFNLTGPDLSATDLAGWFAPLSSKSIVLINTASSSAPFLPGLAGNNRVIITATRSGNERNSTRFGEMLAATLTDPAADLDQSGHTSLLEWFLRASSRTQEFYLADGRIQTEHPLLEDNGDGKGTPADWFRGLRPTRKSRDAAPPDGNRAHLLSLVPDEATQKLSPTQRNRRDELETQLTQLREQKSNFPEEAYFLQLESLLRQLASLYPR